MVSSTSSPHSELIMASESSSPPSSPPNKVLDSIMQAKTSRVCKNLTWNAYRNMLPTNSCLFDRGLTPDNTCPCCSEVNETTTHVFLQCREVRHIWFAYPLGLRMDLSSNNNFTQWIDQCVDMFDITEMGLLCAMVWALWRKRNAWNFYGKIMNCSKVIDEALWQCRIKSDEVKPYWIPPPFPYVKGNFYAYTQRHSTGMGVIFRDFKLHTLASATSFLKQKFDDPFTAEAICFRWAIRQAKLLGYFSVIFENDCPLLCNRYNQILLTAEEESACEFDLLLKGCKKMLQGTNSCLVYAPGLANKVAHALAQIFAAEYGQTVWIRKVPNKASILTESDFLTYNDHLAFKE